jgi:hypothetical protein
MMLLGPIKIFFKNQCVRGIKDWSLEGVGRQSLSDLRTNLTGAYVRGEMFGFSGGPLFGCFISCW